MLCCEKVRPLSQLLQSETASFSCPRPIGQADCPSTCSNVNTASRRLRPTCWSANCCGFLRPPPRRHSDWAERGAGGRSLWRRWCRAVRCAAASARLLLHPASLRTGRIRRRCCSRGDTGTSRPGRVRPEPARSLRGTPAVSMCGSGQQGSS